MMDDPTNPDDSAFSRITPPAGTAAGHNPREHIRVEVNQEFQPIEEYIAEYVSNISQGGVFIRSKNPLPEGTEVALQFSIILEDLEEVRGEGVVVRVSHSPDNMGMGIAFTRLDVESKALIDEICRRAGVDI